MRRFLWIGLLALALVAAAEHGYALSRHVTQSGEMSGAAGYSLQSVIGQPEAGVSTGGDYQLSSGFLWPSIATTPAPTPPAPEPTPTVAATAPAPAVYPLYLPLVQR